MASTPAFSFRALADVGLSPRGLYSVALGTALGSTVWVSFIGGIIMFKNLPRQQFGNLQNKLFPAYFALTSTLAAILLPLQLQLHPLPHPLLPSLRSRSPSTILPLLISIMLGSSLANWFLIGPYTSRLMMERHKLERKEGKKYDEAGVSEEMKGLNKRFGKAHGYSALVNLAFFFPTLLVSAWVGQHGV